MFMKGKDGNYLGKFELYPGVKVSLMVSRGISMLYLPWGNNKLTMLLWTVQGAEDDYHYKLCPGVAAHP